MILSQLGVVSSGNAQVTDSVTLVPGPEYAAGPMARRLLGTDYRDLWTATIRVPILDLARFAGGLTPLRQGGGLQTISLRLQGADGREYAFRSVAKRPAMAADPDLAGALLGHLIQDQVSSIVPAAPLAAAPLSAAVGLLHAQPALYVMPDDGRLGEFRQTFAGLLGTIEEYADEAEGGGSGFEGFTRIAGTEELLEALQESSLNRIDSRQYLRARLTDLVIGDWDRHADQWRWARREVPFGYEWLPIPRDRDYAFADYDGLLMKLVRKAVPNAVKFEPNYRHLQGLLLNGYEIDRRMLADLDRAAWDSVSADLAARLTDAAIDEALSHLPEPFLRLQGAEIASRLRIRRDLLPEATARFYRDLAQVPSIVGTDENEAANVTRFADGSVEVTLAVIGGTGEAGRPYYRRVFRPEDTEEIRIELEGGNDRAVVRGASNTGTLVRIMGGDGDDQMADSSRVARTGRWTWLHDAEGSDRLLAGAQTTIHRRPFDDAPSGDLEGLVRLRGKDYGRSLSFRPIADYSTTRGLVFGGNSSLTYNAFRRAPYRSRVRFDLQYSSKWDDFGGSIRTSLRSADPALWAESDLLASRIEATRFYGLGNSTTGDLPSRSYVVRTEILRFGNDLYYSLGSGVVLSAGMLAKVVQPRPMDGSPLDMLGAAGSRRFGSIGLRGEATWRNAATDSSAFRYRLSGLASGIALPSDSHSRYGDLAGHAMAEFPLVSSGFLTLRPRAGGKYVFGNYPYFDAAYLGGRHNLRGFPEWRFAGDGMVYGGADLTAALGRLPLLLNWRFGAFAFMDAGRVFLEGEQSNRWHSAPGVGVALSALTYDLRISTAFGPSRRIYLELGDPF